tara:strand:- start:1938 stop:2654 length:717 start_codon:yes stop_codon:yes gene_type:complete
MKKYTNTAGVRKDGSQDDQYYSNSRPEILSRVPDNPGRVLDVGCGNGMVGSAIKDKYPNSQVIGIEFSKEAAGLAADKLDDVWRINLNELSSDDIHGEFDVIICADVIEHLLDPQSCLQILHSKLTQNGIVILSIPNVGHWSVVLPLLIKDRFTYTDQGLLDKTHLHLFTYTEIKIMLSACNFKILSTNLNILKQRPTENILNNLLKFISESGGNVEFSKSILDAYQFIIVATPKASD